MFVQLVVEKNKMQVTQTYHQFHWYRPHMRISCPFQTGCLPHLDTLMVPRHSKAAPCHHSLLNSFRIHCWIHNRYIYNFLYWEWITHPRYITQNHYNLKLLGLKNTFVFILPDGDCEGIGSWHVRVKTPSDWYLGIIPMWVLGTCLHSNPCSHDPQSLLVLGLKHGSHSSPSLFVPRSVTTSI